MLYPQRCTEFSRQREWDALGGADRSADPTTRCRRRRSSRQPLSITRKWPRSGNSIMLVVRVGVLVLPERRLGDRLRNRVILKSSNEEQWPATAILRVHLCLRVGREVGGGGLKDRLAGRWDRPLLPEMRSTPGKRNGLSPAADATERVDACLDLLQSSCRRRTFRRSVRVQMPIRRHCCRRPARARRARRPSP